MIEIGSWDVHLTQKENQAIGNRLFQYCWAREIAEKKGFCFITDPIPGFPETYKILPGKKIDNNVLFTGVCPSTGAPTQIFNMNEIYDHSGKITIHGYPQRYEYYAFNKNNISKWLTIENEELYDVPDEYDIVLHVRLGDYLNSGWNLSIEYYKSILKKEKYKNAYIITDDPNNQEIYKLIDFGCILKDNSMFGSMAYMADFVFAKKAKKIIISPSTFSWWAAFLGEGIVYFPSGLSPIWGKSPGINNIDLRVLDDPRYKFVEEF
jgi:hypothetical protein